MPFFDVGSQFLGFDLGVRNGQIRATMTTITLDHVPRIVQGAGALGSIGSLVKDLPGAGGAVLLVADPGLRSSGMIDEVNMVKTPAALIIFATPSLS